MQNKKYLSMLGLARRAGRLSMGHDMAMKAVKEGKAKLVIFSSDISPRLVGEFERACSAKNIPCKTIEETIEDIQNSLGYKAGVIAVNDENFAGRTEELIVQARA